MGQGGILTQKHCKLQSFSCCTPQLNIAHQSGAVVLTLALLTVFFIDKLSWLDTS